MGDAQRAQGGRDLIDALPVARTRRILTRNRHEIAREVADGIVAGRDGPEDPRARGLQGLTSLRTSFRTSFRSRTTPGSAPVRRPPSTVNSPFTRT